MLRHALLPKSTHNFTLKIVALFIATVLWGFVASQRRGNSSDIVFTLPVILKNIPVHLQVLNSNVESASVLINLAPGSSSSINPALFQLIVNLKDSQRGPTDKHLSPSNLVYNNQPLSKDMRVSRINPNRIRIQLAESIEHLVKISPRLSGTPAKGFSIISTHLEPPEIVLSGPRSILEKITRVFTIPINISNLSDNKETNFELQLPQYVRLSQNAPQKFQARIIISESPIRRLKLDIPVVFENARPNFQYQHSVNKVNAYLLGTENNFEKWNQKNIHAVLDLSPYKPGDYRGLKPLVQLPANIRVLEQWPIVDLFVINRTTNNSDDK